MAFIINIIVPIFSFVGSYLLWDQSLNGYYDYGNIMIFVCYVFAVVPAIAYSEFIKNRYQIPNQSKSIIFNGKKFKKNSFDPINEIPLGGIKIGIGIVVLAWGSYLIYFLFSEFLPAVFSGPFDPLN